LPHQRARGVFSWLPVSYHHQGEIIVRTIPKCDDMHHLLDYVDINNLVDVYRNLHKGCYSVRQGGKVRAHMDMVRMTHCRFVVSESGRVRVVESGRKNVHAFVRGFASVRFNLDSEKVPATIKYNPYRWQSFMQETLTVDGIEYSPCLYRHYAWLSPNGIRTSYV
jgi:hypothetical protein